jgi:peptidoglycan biosynthesis protein MviN/MurJ (putative lipid II flippase)
LNTLSSWVTSIIIGVLPKIISLFREVVVGYKYGISGELGIYILILATVGLPLSIFGNAIQNLALRKIAGYPDDITIVGLAIRSSFLYLNLIGILVLPLFLFIGTLAFELNISTWYSEVFIKIIENSSLIAYYFLALLLSGCYTAIQATRYHNYQLVLPALGNLCFAFAIIMLTESSVNSLISALIFANIVEVTAAFLVIRYIGLKLLIKNKQDLKDCLLFLNFSAIIKYISVNILSALTPLVKQYAFSSISIEVVSIVSYANKIPGAVSSLVLSATSTVATRIFMIDLKYNGSNSAIKSINKNILILFIVSSIGIIPLMVFGVHLLDILFQRGSISKDDIEVISTLQYIFLIEIPFLVVAMFAWRSIVLVASVSKLALLTTISNIGQIAIIFLGVGISILPSIFIIVVCASVFNAFVLLYYIKRELKGD